MSDILKDLQHKYLATGVGSVSYADAADAVENILQQFERHIPFWPQMPRRSFCENMYVQFTENLPGIHVDEARKSVWVDTEAEDYLVRFEECFQKIQASKVDYFSIGRPYAEGLYALSEKLMVARWDRWVKGQVIGPISLGLTLLDERKNPIIYNPELFEMLDGLLAMKSAWLVRHLRVTGRTRVIIFIDEPYLVAVGTSQCSLPKATIIEKINRLVSLIHENGALAGLHCCGNTDWELVLETHIDILNFDAYSYYDKLLLYDKALVRFLKKGGIPALGIVPNNEDILQPGLLERIWKELMQRKDVLANGALVTTSCGCSALSSELTQKAFAACTELAGRLTSYFNG
ncbi:MAG: hypothetical protein PHH75_05405 [Candidatus Omnitrophica bacterium]|nr:hypothetical protein [Candidatus Omnitrophota bacterium]MDD5574597.1 hypothetical protein [Candidatus Omnitrophota bacterium]